jgi:hypothetical protein
LVNYIEREKGGGVKKELIWKPRQEARGIDWRSNNASQRPEGIDWWSKAW